MTQELAQLRLALAQAQEKLAASEARIEQAGRLKADFLANMGHEIRTPMNAIIGLSRLALKTELTPRQRDYISKVQASGQQLMCIINDLLDFSKVESGSLALESVDFELEKLLSNTSILISEKCHAKGLELVFKVAPDVPRHLVGDSLRLGQILLNYADNAVKFTDTGEIVISVRAGELTGKNVMLHFDVRDTGIGLAAEQQEHVFESFSQGGASGARKYGGTGLGLAISKKLALLMHGDVGVQSEEGAGSTFWFSARLGVGASARRDLLPNPDLRGRKALVVDDNDHARLVIAEMLESMTFITHDVASGAAAVDEVRRAAIENQPYDIVYLDWRMPGMDGMDTARRIKALGLAVPPLLVMVTAYAREEVLRQAESIGIDDVLVKPVNPSILFDTTMSVLGSARLSQPARRRPVEVKTPDNGLMALRGARILVVEDNDINQQVARELLEDEGFIVDVAGDGMIALQMVQQRPYDLVFMDMQMPVMDGLTATREIRKIARLRKLPVVAMTANAMEQDRQRCLEAGMNDAVIKPINQQHLWQVLRQWIARPDDAPAAQSAVAATTVRTQSTVLEALKMADVPQGIAGLDTALGLSRVMGKRSLYIDVLRRYVTGQAAVCAQIHRALADGDLAFAERLAHTTKAVSGTVGATEIQRFAEVLEQSLKNFMPPLDVQRHLLELDGPLSAMVEALELHFEGLPPSAGPDSRPMELTAVA